MEFIILVIDYTRQDVPHFILVSQFSNGEELAFLAFLRPLHSHSHEKNFV